MATATAVTSALNPIGDHSRSRRLLKVVVWIAVAVAVFALLEVFGVDVTGWIAGLWDALRSVSIEYLVAAVALQSLQTTLTGWAWLQILRAGYPEAHIPFAPILAAYAVGTALNGVLPANAGLLVTLFMFAAVIPNATFAGVFAGLVVEKIFFSVLGAFVYVYLFVTAPGSFHLELGGLTKHPLLIALIVVGAIALLYFAGRFFMSKLRAEWRKAKQGGAILSSPRRYALEVVLPSAASFGAKLGTIAVFLAAFSIPVTFGSVMHVVGGNSIAAATAATPGGAGVNEAVSVVALAHYTDAQSATAFSVAQHLVGTSWNILFALVLVTTVFGWTSGTALMKSAYADARHHKAKDGAPA